MGTNVYRWGSEITKRNNGCNECSRNVQKYIYKDRTSWGNILAEEIIKAGEEEKQLAKERGDIVNGYPAITVIVDGDGQKDHTNTATMLSRGLALL